MLSSRMLLPVSIALGSLFLSGCMDQQPPASALLTQAETQVIAADRLQRSSQGQVSQSLTASIGQNIRQARGIVQALERRIGSLTADEAMRLQALRTNLAVVSARSAADSRVQSDSSIVLNAPSLSSAGMGNGMLMGMGNMMGGIGGGGGGGGGGRGMGGGGGGAAIGENRDRQRQRINVSPSRLTVFTYPPNATLVTGFPATP